MVVVVERPYCSSPDSSKKQAGDIRVNASDFSWEKMEEKSSYGKLNLQQMCDNVLKSNSKTEQAMEKDIEMDCESGGCNAQEPKSENTFAVDELRLISPCQGTEKNLRMSRSRMVAVKRSKDSRSSSVSSSSSSRSGSVTSSGSSRSSSACSPGSSRSSSMSSSGRSRSTSISSSERSQSSSASSASTRSSSLSSLERYGSSSDDVSFSSRGRYVPRRRNYRRSRRTCSRSRSRSWSRSCYRRSRCRMSYRSPQRYRSRPRYSRSYRRPRSSLRYRRSRSRSWSRSPSRFRSGYYGFAYKTQPRSHQRSRSRSRDRSFHLTQKDKQKLLEIAKANADKLLGKSNICLPPSLRPASPLNNERLFEMKTNSDAVKALTRKEYKKEAEDDEPLQKLTSASSRIETNHWIAFSVKNTVAKPLNQKTANTSRESPEYKRKGSPYGQWVLVHNGCKNTDKTKTC
ncbi:arginine/serine-rich protein 1 [Stegostoma tigrinum]|uniref:arginine/serine-rich protein 1 n=1 Tax=Stegostoma tigrinum TaxID=3053191 RepID=UPI00202B7708|nr:arginine/serine-rich protein 1 [Stegostoma tigrinum]